MIVCIEPTFLYLDNIQKNPFKVETQNLAQEDYECWSCALWTNFFSFFPNFNYVRLKPNCGFFYQFFNINFRIPLTQILFLYHLNMQKMTFRWFYLIFIILQNFIDVLLLKGKLKNNNNIIKVKNKKINLLF